MVIERVGNKSLDQRELEELQKLAAKGISDDEILSVVDDYKNQEDEKSSRSFDVIREEYKRERTQENFKSGSGIFRRG